MGILADPTVVEYGYSGKHYLGPNKTGSFSVQGVLYGSHSWHQLWEQFIAAAWIIVFTAVMTSIIFYLVKFLVRGLREDDATLEVGDLAIHDEEAFPAETFAERVTSLTR